MFIALRAARAPALADRKYRHPSRASPVFPHPVLPVALSAARQCRSGTGAAPDDLGKLPLGEPASVGRKAAKADVLPRGPSALRRALIFGRGPRRPASFGPAAGTAAGSQGSTQAPPPPTDRAPRVARSTDRRPSRSG